MSTIPFDLFVKLLLAELERSRLSLKPLDHDIAICSLVVDIKEGNNRDLADYALLWNWPVERIELELDQIRQVAMLVCKTHFSKLLMSAHP